MALKWAGGAQPAYVQGAGNASAYVGGGFNTWTIAFPANNTAGNCLVVDVAFVGYIGMLISIQQQSIDRDNKVHYIDLDAPRRTAPEPQLLLRRSGS